MKGLDRSILGKVQSGSGKKDFSRSNNKGCSTDTRRLAKISRPKIGRAYLRAELFQKLQKTRDQRVVWISAPAGAGKTTLAADYVSSHGLDCLWYQIDAGDADPATFFHYLGLAVDQLATRQRCHLPHFTPEYLQDPATFTRHYFEKLYTMLDPPAVVVLDSFQRLSPDAPLQNLFAEMVAVLPEGVRLVFVSRNEPPSWFARLKAQRVATLLDAKDIQLTADESIGVARLFHKETHPRYSDETIRVIHRQAKGWAAGLMLMLESLQREDIDIVLDDGAAQKSIFDYFANELFDEADPEEQAFLLKSALLPQMPLALVAEFTGYLQTKRILTNLYNRNFFLTRRVGAELVYEYHPLFRDFLLNRGVATWDSQWLQDLRHQAAQSLLASGQAEMAIDLMLLAQDWEQAAVTIVAEAPRLISQGRNQALKTWSSGLPDELLKDTPWLLYWLGSCHVGGDVAVAGRCFDTAFPLFEKVEDPAGSFLTLAAALQLAWVTQQDYRVIDLWLERFEGLQQRYPQYPSPEIEARVITSVLMGMYFCRPDHPISANLLKRAESLWDTGLDPNLRWQIGSVLGYALLGKGGLPKWIDAIRRFEPTRNELEFMPVERLYMLTSIALGDCYSGAYESGLEHVEQALLLADRTGIHLFDFWAVTAGVYSTLIQGELKTADKYLEKMRSLPIIQSQNLGRAHHLILLSWRALHEGEYERAVQTAQLALELMESRRAAYPVALGYCCLAHALFESGDNAQAHKLIEKIRIPWGEGRHEQMLYQYDFTRACFCLKEGDSQAAQQWLEKALRRGHDQNYGLPLLSRPGFIQPLLNLALEHQIETAYVERLIQQANITPQDSATVSRKWPLPVRIFTLGRFSLLINGEPLSLSLRSKNRPLDLLKMLMAFGGQNIAEGKVMDALWPDATGDAARRALNTTLHRLRKLLAIEGAVILKDGRITLDCRYFWVDAWVLEHVLRQIDRRLGESQPNEAAIEQLSKKAIELYRGPFLDSDSTQHWSLAMAERMRSRVIRAYLALGGFWEKRSDWNHAIEAYQEGIEIDYLVEAFYPRLMCISDHQGRHAEALATYEHCRKALSTALGVMPGPETLEIYLGVKANAKKSFDDGPDAERITKARNLVY